MGVQAFGVGDPSQTTAGDSGYAKVYCVAVAEFCFAVEQELG